MRQDHGRRALQYGLVGSAILHLALLALNPGVDVPGTGATARGVRIPPDAIRVVELESSEGARTRTLPRVPGIPVPIAHAPAPDSGVAAGRPATALRSSREPTAIERLTAPRSPLLSRPPQAAPETREQAALRELAARLEQAGREEAAAAKDPWTVLGRVGGVEIIAGNGDVGVRIPFGRKPPPPAQVVPAPRRLALLGHDSTRRRGDLVHAWHAGYSIALPAALTQGVSFEVSAHFPGPVERALVRFFIDDVAAADAIAVNGVAHASLRIESPGAHRIRVHFLDAGAYAPAQLLHAVQVDAAPAESP